MKLRAPKGRQRCSSASCSCSAAFSAELLLALALCAPADAGRQPRSRAALAEFKLANPCPATGATRGPCPGFVIDHTIPLACGGLDQPSNMAWQTIEAGREKDRTERKECWLIRRPGGI